MSTRLLEFRGIRLVINQSVVLVELVFTRRSELSFRCLLSKIIFSILSMLYIEHCLLILPLFVAICGIWLSGLTYGAYLVLFLKSSAIIWECHLRSIKWTTLFLDKNLQNSKLLRCEIEKMTLFQELFHFSATQGTMLANATYPAYVKNVLE